MRLALILIIFVPLVGFSQLRKQPDASKIKLDLKKLNTLGTVLYLAAHPDDENTQVISYLVNDQVLTTGYLSLTRGDGGQNLIGPEIRDLLGVIRTQELLSARRLDGGQQFFTRAIDFGFSKSAKETFEIWNKQDVLSDVIHVIRQFQPDVILTRFPPDERAGHGQHTASAMLALEAFDQSGQPDVFKDQVSELGTWQVKRVFNNTGRWWSPNINESTPGIIMMNVGAYNPLLGKSYSELSAESRTQHKSQGFGSSGRRGDAPEYFELAKGDKPEKNILDGVDTHWTRVKGGDKVGPLVDAAIKNFNDNDPAASVPQLLLIRQAIQQLDPGIWKTRKLNDVNELVQNCLALFVEVTADKYWTSPGESVGLKFEVVNRSSLPVDFLGIHAADLSFDSTFTTSLKDNSSWTAKSRKSLNSNEEYSGPYWLKQPHGLGLFTVTDPHLIGRPESDPAVMLDFTFAIGAEKFNVRRPLFFKWNDPVKGEQARPFEVVPPVFINMDQKVVVFSNEQPKEIDATITLASDKPANGVVRLVLPDGWKASPKEVPFSATRANQEIPVHFSVTPSSQEAVVTLSAIVELNGKTYDRSLQTIQYDHIPLQTLLPKAESKLLRMNLKTEGGLVAYIGGAGDETPDGLRNMGYQVWEMKDEEVTPDNLKKVDAVVLGVRALNTNDRIKFFMPDLFQYVKEGGTMITQYNNDQNLELDKQMIAPYPLSLSRDRVTEENSEVRILKPDHPALNIPNKITAADFSGWVQERGLYYPNKWDDHFEALLSMNDTGETPKDGGLLVANYGEGHYVYTGISFFRELPEGVPGAYKLFANLVSLGKMKKPESSKVKTKAK